MEDMPNMQQPQKKSKGGLRVILIICILVAFIAVVFGGNTYFEDKGTFIDPSDVSVSSGVTCSGGCLYYGVASYPVGTACLGLKPGDPDGAGGQWTGEDYSNRCYVCGSNGSFEEKDLNMCSHCYAQCLGDLAPIQYENGDQCASGTGEIYGIYTCRNGKWEKEAQTKCTGQCPGDGPYTLYDLGHSCFAQNQCYQCAEPGREFQGGFDLVTNEVCQQNGSIGNNAQFQAQCIEDSAVRDYDHGDECNAGTGADYGTYVCNNGTWERAQVEKCVVANSVGGYRPVDLLEKGDTFKYVGACLPVRRSKS